MKIGSRVHAFSAKLAERTLRENYWAVGQLWAELQRARTGRLAAFWAHARADFARYMAGSIVPITDETQGRATAAVDWLLRAQQATPDDGVSLGYFPCDAGSPTGWRPSYPETTGYIISSLLAYSRTVGDAAARTAAFRLGRWEAEIQMSSGAVQGGPVCHRDQQTAAAFNTGMVLDGWCSLLEQQQDEQTLAAARGAADFLVGDLDDTGYFRTNGRFVSAGEVKTYTCLCAWALHRFGDLTNEARYRRAAVRSIEAALRQQQPNGWFAHNCLTRSSAPLTHTIGYTLQGVLEVGRLANRPDFVAAAVRAMDAISSRVEPNGYLPGRFFADWSPASVSSCLTGSAQLAIVAYRLADIERASLFRLLGDRLLNFVKALQAEGPGDPGVDGAIAGSFPLFGEYMRGGYPNWATKYYLDALLLQHRADVGGMP